MSVGLVLVIVLVAIGLVGLAGLVWLWLSTAWEVVDDDTLHEL